MDEQQETRTRGTNRLGAAKSPYLLQHASNPVDWYPWEDEAFQRARTEEKPIFLSIGYATCHWCHVMAHESFEDEEVAALLNKHFVAIKVDREERPDIDHIYMSVCQAITGSGGWPLSVFMTPEAKPFFAGTYFPKHGRKGMPGFVQILTQLAAMWERDRARLLESSDTIVKAVQPAEQNEEADFGINMNMLRQCVEQFRRTFDTRWGGFGSAPKFPTPHNLSFLLRWYERTEYSSALQMAEKTLEGMRNGGIFDHIGFGFHRYSVDERWLVPHFEKMLYDQALLAIAYAEAWQVTGKDQYREVVHEIFSYVLRDMTSPEGGFYSAEDADSEGVEGLFYVWTPAEVKDILGKDRGDLFCRYFQITEEGNFEHGRSIPHTIEAVASFAEHEGMTGQELQILLTESRQQLFDKREHRVHPFKDDKILTAWNGLMIAALSIGYRACGNQQYVDAARKSADFIMHTMVNERGRIYRRYRNGDVAIPGFLEDYAFLTWGLIEFYEATYDVHYLEEAITVTRRALDLFWDEARGGFLLSGKDNEQLIAPSRDIYDGATPSGNSVALLNLARLAGMTSDKRFEDAAQALVDSFSSDVASYPMAHTHFLMGVDFMFGPLQEIVVAGRRDEESTQAMIRCVQRAFLPRSVVMLHEQGAEGEALTRLLPHVKDMKPIQNQTAAYVCENFACSAPVTAIDTLKELVRRKKRQ
ncbi:MAG TPA: thioredoxin domain-containing protein [Thermodesulfobacteriota bacterium]|nr:thioredoxin domain-containing protein [Deltaproteobacteria bacterium]HNR14707.1 thioredoxin domain-containing protein [Thermodesulfobacteriota bacterium]HNU70481.1 thioredoxin domain-containing protein [Thermodesulfobacteriota bacterium]HQO77001.1 thioredoxin domain-containing protein [Thermodesulfobacteriota bacterium]